MKRYFITKQDETDVFARPEMLVALSFDHALSWCMKHGYDLIEEV